MFLIRAYIPWPVKTKMCMKKKKFLLRKKSEYFTCTSSKQLDNLIRSFKMKKSK